MAEKKEAREDFSIVAYVFGIVSIVLAFFTPAAGIVFGIVGLVQSKRQRTPLSTRAKKLSIIGLVLSVILLVVSLVLATYFAYNNIGNLANFPIA